MKKTLVSNTKPTIVVAARPYGYLVKVVHLFKGQPVGVTVWQRKALDVADVRYVLEKAAKARLRDLRSEEKTRGLSKGSLH